MKRANKIFLFCVILLGAAFIIRPQTVAGSVKGTMEKCAGSLIPGLFPFMVLGNMLVECGGAEILKKAFSGITKKFLRLSGACSLPIIVGFISGFPVGASVTAEMVKKGEITKSEGERVLCFCNNPGPAFIITAVGGMLGLGGVGGGILWFSVMISALLAGICFGKGKTGAEEHVLVKSGIYPQIAECVVTSIKKSVISMLNVCGFVIFFGVITDVILLCGTQKTAETALGGFFEVTTGCVKLSEMKLPQNITLPFASMLLSWSGLCAHAQVAAAVSDCGISLRRYIKTKILQAVTSPVIAYFTVKKAPFSIAVSAKTPTDPSLITAAWTFIGIVVGFGLVLAGFQLFQRIGQKQKSENNCRIAYGCVKGVDKFSET